MHKLLYEGINTSFVQGHQEVISRGPSSIHIYGFLIGPFQTVFMGDSAHRQTSSDLSAQSTGGCCADKDHTHGDHHSLFHPSPRNFPPFLVGVNHIYISF